MLYLRRAAGQSITFIQDRKILGTITVSQVDVETDTIDIDYNFGPARIGHRTLLPGTEIRLLEAALTFKFSFILEYEDYPDAASVGIKALDSIDIYRSERLTGLGPDQIAALRNTRR